MQFAKVLSGTPKTSADIQEAKQSRGGRPYKGGKEKVCNVQIKLTPEEHAQVFALAKTVGKTVTDLFKESFLPKEKPVKGSIALTIKSVPTYLTPEQAKDLYMQLTKLLIG